MKPETYIKKYSMTVPVKQIAKHLGRSPTYVIDAQERLGCRPPKRIRQKFARQSQIKKGNVPPNKGKKMSKELKEKVKHTFFKKGNLPHNTRHDGAISIRPDKDGRPYKYIRVGLKKWIGYHVYRWEKFRGPVPKGMVIRFKDGNPLNCKLSNLELMTRGDHAIINKFGSLELLKTRQIIKQIHTKIHEKQNQRSQ